MGIKFRQLTKFAARRLSAMWEPLSNPSERVGLGVVFSLFVLGSDVIFSEVTIGRGALTILMTTLTLWLLTPTARLSGRRPFYAALQAAFVGAGAGAIWWAIASPAFWIWIPISVGAGVAVMSLAPLVDEPHTSGEPPPRSHPAAAAKDRRAI